MTGLEVIPKITALLTELIGRVKDGKTAGIVAQIQSHFQTLQAAYFAAEQKVTESGRQQFALERELAQASDAHAKEVAGLKAENTKRVTEHEAAIAQLKQDHAAEIAKFQKASEYTKGEGFSSGGNRVGTPPGY